MNAVESLLRAHIRDSRAKIAAAAASVDALEAQVDRFKDRPGPQPGNRIHELDGWSAEEDAVIREHYPKVGAVGCHKFLPHRSANAIRSHASRKLKIKVASGNLNQRVWCDQCQTKVLHGQIVTCLSEFCDARKIVAAEKGQ